MKKRTRLGILGLTLALSGGAAGISGTAFGHNEKGATHFHELDSLGCGPIWLTLSWLDSGQAKTWISCIANKLGSGALDWAKGIVTKHEPFKTLADIAGKLWDMVKEIKEACTPMSKLPKCALDVVANKIPGGLGKFLQFLLGPEPWADKFKKIGDSLADFFGGWVDDVKKGITDGISKLLDPVVKKVTGWVEENVIDPALKLVTEKIDEKINDGVKWIVARLLGAADAIKSGSGAVQASASAIDEKAQKIAAMIDETVTGFGAKVETAKAKLEEYETMVDNFVSNAPKLMTDYALDWLAGQAVEIVLRFVHERLKFVWDQVNTPVSAARAAAVTLVASVPFAGSVLAPLAGKLLDEGYSSLKEEIEKFIDKKITEIIDSLKKKATELVGDAAEKAGGLLASVWKAIKEPYNKIKDKVEPIITAAFAKYKEIAGKVRGLRNKVKDELAKVQAIANGWKKQFEAAADQLKNAGLKVSDLPKYILAPPKEGYPPQTEKYSQRPIVDLAKEGPAPKKDAVAMAAPPPPPLPPAQSPPSRTPPTPVSSKYPPVGPTYASPPPARVPMGAPPVASPPPSSPPQPGRPPVSAPPIVVIPPRAIPPGVDAPSDPAPSNATLIYWINSKKELMWNAHVGVLNGEAKWHTTGGKVVGGGWAFEKVVVGASGDVYAINTQGALLRYHHVGRTTGTSDWGRESGKAVNHGWNMHRFVFAGAPGVLYGVTPGGGIHWYRYASAAGGTTNWETARAANVGSGWQIFKNVVGAPNGVIYGIKPDGTLAWYRHSGFENGTIDWAVAKDVGSGWQGFRQIAAGANGVIYALENDGTIKWYRHVGHADGSVRWEGPKVIGKIDGAWFGVSDGRNEAAQAEPPRTQEPPPRGEERNRGR